MTAVHGSNVNERQREHPRRLDTGDQACRYRSPYIELRPVATTLTKFRMCHSPRNGARNASAHFWYRPHRHLQHLSQFLSCHENKKPPAILSHGWKRRDQLSWVDKSFRVSSRHGCETFPSRCPPKKGQSLSILHYGTTPRACLWAIMRTRLFSW